MALSILKLSEKLNHYSPKTCINKEQHSLVKNIKFTSPNLKSIDEETLYICLSHHHFDSAPSDKGINVLCTKNVLPGTIKDKNPNSNLLILETDIDVYDLYNEINTIFSEEQKKNDNLNRLLNALIGEKGLQNIIDIAYEVLGNPIVVTDMNFKLLGHSKGTNINDPLLDEIIASGYVPHEKLATQFYTERSFDKEMYESDTPLISKINDSMCRRLYGKIDSKDQRLAFLVVYEVNKPFEDGDIELVKFLCDTLLLEMQKNHLIQMRTTNFELFMLELLEGKLRGDAVIQNTMKVLNMKLGKELYVLTVDFSLSDSYAFTVAYIKDQLKELIPCSYVSRYGSWLVMLISNDTSQFEDGIFLNKFSRFLKKNNLLAGLSLSFGKLTEAKKYFLQSIKALELRTRLNKKINFCNYKDYLVYDLINASSTQCDIRKFCHPLVDKIVEYDKMHNTLYAETLYAYIAKGKDKFSTADFLHVHRNTMKYRLGKIEELFHIDWADSELLLALQLTFKMLEYEGQCDIFTGV